VRWRELLAHRRRHQLVYTRLRRGMPLRKIAVLAVLCISIGLAQESQSPQPVLRFTTQEVLLVPHGK
jgi:hypothetical protein